MATVATVRRSRAIERTNAHTMETENSTQRATVAEPNVLPGHDIEARTGGRIDVDEILGAPEGATQSMPLAASI